MGSIPCVTTLELGRYLRDQESIDGEAEARESMEQDVRSESLADDKSFAHMLGSMEFLADDTAAETITALRQIAQYEGQMDRVPVQLKDEWLDAMALYMSELLEEYCEREGADRLRELKRSAEESAYADREDV